MSPERPKARVVFDCMVFLQGAARRESPAAACLLLAEFGVVELCVSTEILSEIRGVLTRPSIQRRFPVLTDARAPIMKSRSTTCIRKRSRAVRSSMESEAFPLS
jgi:predicted nucleic acid-binding protein